MKKTTYSKHTRYCIVDRETGEIIRDLASPSLPRRKPYPGPRKARLRPLGYYRRQQLYSIIDFILALICSAVIILALTQF